MQLDEWSDPSRWANVTIGANNKTTMQDIPDTTDYQLTVRTIVPIKIFKVKHPKGKGKANALGLGWIYGPLIS